MTDEEFEEKIKKYMTPERKKHYADLYRDITSDEPFDQKKCDRYVEVKILTDFYDGYEYLK